MARHIRGARDHTSHITLSRTLSLTLALLPPFAPCPIRRHVPFPCAAAAAFPRLHQLLYCAVLYLYCTRDTRRRGGWCVPFWSAGGVLLRLFMAQYTASPTPLIIFNYFLSVLIHLPGPGRKYPLLLSSLPMSLIPVAEADANERANTSLLRGPMPPDDVCVRLPGQTSEGSWLDGVECPCEPVMNVAMGPVLTDCGLALRTPATAHLLFWLAGTRKERASGTCPTQSAPKMSPITLPSSPAIQYPTAHGGTVRMAGEIKGFRVTLDGAFFPARPFLTDRTPPPSPSSHMSRPPLSGIGPRLEGRDETCVSPLCQRALYPTVRRFEDFLFPALRNVVLAVGGTCRPVVEIEPGPPLIWSPGSVTAPGLHEETVLTKVQYGTKAPHRSCTPE